MIRTVYRSSCKVLVILVRFEWNLNFLHRFSKNIQISNFMKIRPVGDGASCYMRTDTHTHRQTDMMKRMERTQKYDARFTSSTFSTDVHKWRYPQSSRYARIPQLVDSHLTCSWSLKSATYFDGRGLSILSRPSDTLTNESQKPEVLGMWLGELHVHWGADSLCSFMSGSDAVKYRICRSAGWLWRNITPDGACPLFLVMQDGAPPRFVFSLCVVPDNSFQAVDWALRTIRMACAKFDLTSCDLLLWVYVKGEICRLNPRI